MRPITPHLWFDDQAEEAANLYVSLFPNSRIVSVARYPKAAEAVSGKKAGSVMTVQFELNGQPFMALNGGAAFTLNGAVSFVVYCDSQEEIDRYWAALSADPSAEQCGWCKDRFGLFWQIVPTALEQWMGSGDQKKTEAVTTAFLGMKKFDIATLQNAFDGG